MARTDAAVEAGWREFGQMSWFARAAAVAPERVLILVMAIARLVEDRSCERFELRVLRCTYLVPHSVVST